MFNNKTKDTSWSPLEGCEDPAVAMKRAATFVASSGIGGENAVWLTSGVKIVQAMLHACALEGLGVEKLFEWTASPRATNEAIEILRRRGASKEHLDGLDAALRKLQKDDARMKSNKWFAVNNGYASMASEMVGNI